MYMQLLHGCMVCLVVSSGLDVLTDNLKDVYTIMRCQPVEDEWPPNQPKTIVNVALMHHEGEQTQQELIDMSSYHKKGASAIDKLRVTKSIVDIFTTISKSILIEGAPGIGKTVLCKEISYYWASDKILIGMKLFLLVIRHPKLHCVNSVSGLIHYLNNDYLSDSEVESAANELRRSKGSNIVFVLDGYDECPPDSPLKEFIDNLIKGVCLCNSVVVVTSRPTASMPLRQIVSHRIEILGFARKARDKYISESLQGLPEKQNDLEKYLKHHPVINSLLYVPLHLAVLMFLFKEGNLPESLTEINEYFIVHTVYRHLAKQNQRLFRFSKLTDLPQQILHFVYQLSALAFKGLQNSQLVFTYDEVVAVSPNLQHTPDAINGFGLLQAIKHTYMKGARAGSDVSLNFLHFTMQEYLAALHVSTLPSYQQLSLIKETFWDSQYNFMWMMYVGITGIKSIYFNEVLKSLEQIDAKFRQKKYLFLFQCCLEEKNSDLIPTAITSIFSDGYINLSGCTLLPNHVVSLNYFMMRSTTKWTSLNLRLCSIGDDTMTDLAKFSMEYKEIFTEIESICLSYNCFTSLWGTYIDTDEDSDDSQVIAMSNSGLLSVARLDISHNQLSHEGLSKLMVVVTHNTTLTSVNIAHNKISDNGAVAISDCLKNNITLQELNISKNWMSKEGVMRIVVACTKNRTLHKLVCTHNNLSKSGLAVINEYIRKENAVEIFEGSWNSISSKNDYLTIKTTFHLLDVSSEDDNSIITSGDVSEEFWFISDITDIKYRNEFVECCFKEHKSNQLKIPARLEVDAVGIAVYVLKMNEILMKLDVSCNKICDSGAISISDCLKSNTTLQELNISKNWISKEGVMRIVVACTKNRTLYKLVCTHNNLSKSGLAVINEYIRKENAVEIFEGSWNSISSKNDCLTIKTTFHLLDVPSEDDNSIITSGDVSEEFWFISDITDIKYRNEFVECCFKEHKSNQLKIPARLEVDAVGIAVYVLKMNEILMKLDVSCNKICDSGAISISDCLKSNTTLQELNISKNWISKEGVMRIVVACTKNRTLHKLVCTHNNLSISGLAVISEYIRKENAVEIFEGSWNSISSEDECLAIKTTFHLLDVSSEYCDKVIKSDDISEELWFIDEITDIKYRNKFVECCIMENKSVIQIHLPWHCCRVDLVGIVAKFVKMNRMLQKFHITGQNMTDDRILPRNTTPREQKISYNAITDERAKCITEALQVNTSVQILDISHNEISDYGAIYISECLVNNQTLKELNISKNWISKEGVMRIVVACTKNRTLHKLVCTHNNLSKSGLAVINEYIRKENAVEIFEGSWNSISSKGDKLAIKTTFHLLYVSSEYCDKVMKSDDISEELWFIDEITDIKYRNKFVECCIMENKSVIQIHLPWHCCRVDLLGIIADVLKMNRMLQKFHIIGQNMSDDTVVAISSFLETNTTLRELNISYIAVTNTWAKYITEALQVNTSLQILDISHNEISDYGAMYISDCLVNNQTLKELNISKNWMSKEGVMRIVVACTKNRTLHKLVCTHNYLSKCGLAVIIEYIRKENAVEIFEGSWNCITSKNNDLVIKATFYLLDLTSKDCEKVIKSDNISEQLLYVDEITDINCRRKFVKCCIKENDIQIPNNCHFMHGVDSFTIVVEILGSLQSLNVSDIKLHDGRAIVISTCLTTNTTLRVLNMSNNDITNKGAISIAKALNQNLTLQKLNISKNKISNVGAVDISECLKSNTTLQELNISKNWISKEGVMRIVAACAKNRTLHKLVCTHNNLSKSGLAVINEYIKKENAVEIFEGSWNSISRKDDCLAIKTTLDVSSEDVDISEELWFLDEITDVNYRTEFVECCIKESDVLQINIPKNCYGVNVFDIIGKVLEMNGMSQKLHISGSNINDNEIVAMCNSLKINSSVIKELSISHDSVTNERETLLNTSVLRLLVISCNSISLYGALAISDCLKTNTTQTLIGLTDCKTKWITEALGVNTLQILNISRNKISDDGAIYISNCLKNNKTLQELNISKNWISKEGVMRIVVACTKNRTLHKLVCTHNNLSKYGLAVINEYIKKENAVEIFEGSWNSISSKNDCLAIKTTLDVSSEDVDISEELWFLDEITDVSYRTEFVECCIKESDVLQLNIPKNCYGVNVFDIIGKVLEMNGMQQKLYISGSSINDNGIVAIFNSLKINTVIKELSISYDSVSHKRAIAETLLNTSVLRLLVISSNSISDDGALAISDYLKTNITLIKLDLPCGGLSDQRAKWITEALEVNNTLQMFDISHNRISDDGAIYISECLIYNQTLKELNISKNWISKKGVMRIVIACTKNRTLHKLMCTHNNLSKSGLAVINEYIRKENAVEIFEGSWNSISSKYDRLAIKTTLDVSSEDVDDISEELWFLDKITDINYRTEFVECCIKESDVLQLNIPKNCYGVNVFDIIGKVLEMNGMQQKLYISGSSINDNGIVAIFNSLKISTVIKELSISYDSDTHKRAIAETLLNTSVLRLLVISSNSISDDGALAISDCLKTNTTLIKLDLPRGGLSDQRAKWITEALEVNNTLQMLDISHNRISDDGAIYISDCLKNNNTLQELNISKNWISKEGVMRIVVACTKNRTLHKLVCTHNNLSKSGLAVINEYIRKENTVEIFEGSWNSISSKSNYLAIKTTLSSNDSVKDIKSDTSEFWFLDEITDINYRTEFVECCIKESDVQQIYIPKDCCGVNVFDIIGKVLEMNGMSQKLHISGSNINDNEIVAMCNSLKINSSVIKELSISHDSVTNERETLLNTSVLRLLVISCNSISLYGALAISDCLKTNTTLIKLNLTLIGLTDRKTKWITEALEVNNTLQILNISRNKISDYGAIYISNCLKNNKTLQELNISKNWISKEGVMRIVVACTKNRTLHKLVCTHNNLSKSGLAVINECIRKENAVEIFEGSWNSISSEDESLAIKTTFNLLDVPSKDVVNSDFITEELWCVDKITNINYRTKFVECCIKENNTVLQVHVPSVCFGVNLLGILETIGILQKLHISSNYDCILAISNILKANTTLRELNISHNAIRADGVKNISEALQLNAIVQILDVSSNSISDDGAVTISDYLKTNTTLIKLNLSGNSVTDYGTKQIAEASQLHKTLQVLDISQNKISDDGAIYISDCLKNNKTLQQLNISKNWISKEGVMRIVVACTKNRTLHKLVCTHNNLSKSGLAVINEYIRKENAVEIFEGSWNSISSKEECLAIKTTFDMPSEDIEVDDNSQELWFVFKITDVKYRRKFVECCIKEDDSIQVHIPMICYGVKVFRTLLERIGTLQNSHCSTSGIQDNEVVARNSCHKTSLKITLLRVNLMNEDVNEQRIDWIAKGSLIIQRLDISHSKFSDNQAIAICECLITNTTLIELNLSHNNITDKAAVKICEILQINKTLQSLNIAYNKLNDNRAVAISEYLITNTTLILLNISHNDITDKGANIICKALQVNKTLQVVNMAWNRLSDDGAVVISECLNTNTTLRELNLSGNCITKKGAKIISETLQINKSLQVFDISYNKLLDDGAVTFCECLKTNTTLIELNLSHTYITDRGALKISKILQINETLQKFNISYNNLSDDGAVAISQYLKTNTTLIELNVLHNFRNC